MTGFALDRMLAQKNYRQRNNRARTFQIQEIAILPSSGVELDVVGHMMVE
jgi:hypothetical protein